MNLFLTLLISENLFAKTFGGREWDRPYSITQTSDGGYAVAGYTGGFGAGYADFLVLKLASDGNYTDCVQDRSPTVGTPSLSTSSPSVGATCSPSTSSPSPSIMTPSLTITDVCPPSVEERDVYGRPGITCSPLPGGALFISHEDMDIRIYSADGRLAYSGQLQRGESRIGLEAGVYLWKAGKYRGKVAIRQGR